VGETERDKEQINESCSNVPKPARAGVASGAPIRLSLIPCSDGLSMALPIDVVICNRSSPVRTLPEREKGWVPVLRAGRQ
jgi:hypothetical protein